MKGLIFDIQSHSVHDGPGCRTTVFLNGCPLSCKWCSNPEGLTLKQQLMYSSKKCKLCLRCINNCKSNAIKAENNSLKIERKICRECKDFSCAAACLSEAMQISGKFYSVPELMEVLNRDRHFWGTDGGVTFCGGEPFAQHEFLAAVLNECKNRYIHTAIETSANVPTDIFLDVMELIEWAYIDIKHMDSEIHSKFTGVGNSLILKNIEALTKSGWPGDLLIRMPLIPGFNDDDENIKSTTQFLKKCGLSKIEILPFHRLGESKYDKLGLNYFYADKPAPKKIEIKSVKKLFDSYGIACVELS